MKPEQPTAEKGKNYYSDYGSIVSKDNIEQAVTSDTHFSVPVPKQMATKISQMLNLQDAVLSGVHNELIPPFLALNCRKACFFVTGQMTYADAVDRTVEDQNGINLLLTDVERLQSAGFSPVVLESSYSELQGLLDAYTGSFPCVVHLFEVDTGSELYNNVETSVVTQGVLQSEVLQKLHRIHSFIVLGQDEETYVCFQNMGPELKKPVSIVELDTVLFPLLYSPQRKGVAFFGPVATA